MRRTLKEQIDANMRASWFYAFLVVLLLAALGGAIWGVYDPQTWWLGAAGAAALGFVMALVARFAGSRIILSLSGAREATAEEDRILRNVAEEMAIAAGIPMPKVYVIDDPQPNAFATGPDPKNGVVVFTTGIIQKLNRDELQGVMAHEIAHIRNYDIRFMTMLAMVAGLIPLLADTFRMSLWYGGGRRGGGRRDDSGGQIVFVVIGLALAILAPIFAMLLQFAVSRRREFMADATAAELTRNPEGLASALIKLTQDPTPLEHANRATQHMYIVNPLKAQHAGGTNWFSTHPPIEERVRALRGLAGYRPAMSQDYEV
jgi:heat shock protein HtpX